jgi:rSAM/selenodomain-associated transferase 2
VRYLRRQSERFDLHCCPGRAPKAFELKSHNKLLSVIIPTYNEAMHIAALLEVLQAQSESPVEIIVTDGGSKDNTVEIAKGFEGVTTISIGKGRALQMNAGAAAASSDILFFLHVDSTPPSSFVKDILHAIEHGAVAGCFRLQFDHDHWFLKGNAWFTRFNINGLRFGDQGLFVKKEQFLEVGGFRGDHIVMEDQEIVHRLRQQGRFVVINKKMITSARKYRQHGVFRTQAYFYLIWTLYYCGVSQQQLIRLHRRLTRK